ncbi:carbonic anhydrase [Neobacillus drentensis]|uniref:carbonic anhydrase n=1 Tax=Neobacillus drentensis TaxID=220684 RepID=UPI002859742D|nr:carbonic anhydrase [Neobacillus drentensis]MDR7239678.1 carbonic anhydrase [Neobacillus drentensis]
MSRDEKKKVLFVIGMEQKLERFIKEETNVNPENVLILQTYQPVVSHPFDDLMRDIIIAVYQDHVEEIVVVATNDYQKNTGDILNKIYKNKELQDKIQTFDYLFKNCMPEFPEGTVSLWLQGGKTLKDSVQKTVNIIRNHPLLPSNVKVKELYIDQRNEKLSEIV